MESDIPSSPASPPSSPQRYLQRPFKRKAERSVSRAVLLSPAKRKLFAESPPSSSPPSSSSPVSSPVRVAESRYRDDDEADLPWDYYYWPDQKKRAWDGVAKNPNAYYNKYTHPGIPQAAGKWSMEEHDMFMDVLKVFDPVEGGWGIFAQKMMNSGRSGNQCRAYYSLLLSKGQLKDQRYTDETGSYSPKKRAPSAASGAEAPPRASRAPKAPKGKNKKAEDAVVPEAVVFQDEEEVTVEEDNTNRSNLPPASTAVPQFSQIQAANQLPQQPVVDERPAPVSPRTPEDVFAEVQVVVVPSQEELPPSPVVAKAEALETAVVTMEVDEPRPEDPVTNPEVQAVPAPVPKYAPTNPLKALWKVPAETEETLDVGDSEIPAPALTPALPAEEEEQQQQHLEQARRDPVKEERPSAMQVEELTPEPEPEQTRPGSPFVDVVEETPMEPLILRQSFPEFLLESLESTPLLRRATTAQGAKRRRKEERPTNLSETLQKLNDQQKRERKTMEQGLFTQLENLLCSFEREIKLTLANLDRDGLTSTKHTTTALLRVASKFEEAQTQLHWRLTQEAGILHQLQALQWQKISKQAAPCVDLVPAVHPPPLWPLLQMVNQLVSE